jgi:hypothetical protein
MALIASELLGGFGKRSIFGKIILIFRCFTVKVK